MRPIETIKDLYEVVTAGLSIPADKPTVERLSPAARQYQAGRDEFSAHNFAPVGDDRPAIAKKLPRFRTVVNEDGTQFMIGDVVTLKGNELGPKMTVTGIDAIRRDVVAVCWFVGEEDGKIGQEARFHIDALDDFCLEDDE